MTFAFKDKTLATTGRGLLLALALVATLAPARAGSSGAPVETVTARNEAVVRDAFAHWAAGGNVFTILSPDVVWTIHGSGPVAGTYHGVKDFIDRASAPLVSRLATPITPRVEDIWAVGDTVIVRFDGSATTTSGAPYRNQFVWIFRMKDGAVIEAEAFLDLVAYQRVVENNAPRPR
ncbi:nuclear transport factor 2 family protein [Aquabacter spiritensis]|uniref:SnoaL-like domain-containing protein n=1 Tax=Aquabacter spiritensis TaxID=933073 RepID=A0A4R3LY80_9HYPH|nr:nuclear transport factor 2 family protein [Aquabacter spiritensis]TCT05176.1 hypothetical protein EDC64_105207 [Aquabacter spiritensis]